MFCVNCPKFCFPYRFGPCLLQRIRRNGCDIEEGLKLHRSETKEKNFHKYTEQGRRTSVEETKGYKTIISD